MMPENYTKFILLSIVLFHTGSVSAQNIYINPVSVVEQSPPTFYETLAVLIFKVKLPVRAESDLLSAGLGTCSTSSIATNPWCPLQFHLQKSAATLHSMVTPTTYDAFYSQTTNQQTIKNFCDTIGKHFPSQNLHEDSYASYMTKIRLCSAPLHESTADFPQSAIIDTYRQSMIDYTTAYWVPPNQQYDDATHCVANGVLNSVGMLHHLAEKLAWAEALSNCKSGLIPFPLIPYELMQTELQNLYFKVTAAGFVFSFPHDADHLSTYYNLPLADCTILRSTKELNVRIPVPVHKNGVQTDWKMASVQSIPFRHIFENDAYICSFPEYESKLDVTYDATNFQQSLTYYPPDCRTYNGLNLCRVPRFDETKMGNPTWRKSCLQFILDSSSSENDIASNCQLECQPTNKFNQPVILHAGDNHIYIAGDETVSLMIKCAGEPDIPVMLPLEGALHVTLPCDCSILSGTFIEIIAQQPCSNTNVIYETVRPINFQDKYKSYHFKK